MLVSSASATPAMKSSDQRYLFCFSSNVTIMPMRYDLMYAMEQGCNYIDMEQNCNYIACRPLFTVAATCMTSVEF